MTEFLFGTLTFRDETGREVTVKYSDEKLDEICERAAKRLGLTESVEQQKRYVKALEMVKHAPRR